MAVVRKCVCCGREYDYCPNCEKKSQPAWKVSFCNETCKELFNVLSAYNTKRVDKSVVKSFIADHGISNIEKYTAPIQEVLSEVLSSGAPSSDSYNNNGGWDTYSRRKRRRR